MTTVPRQMTMAGTNYKWAHLATLCAIALLVGCASLGPQLPMDLASEAGADSDVPGVRVLNSNGEFETLSSREVAQRLSARLGERPLSILALSSGGASGAFGAGALVGSTGSGTRGDFAVVTGVSSGALLAPFAFLGPSQDSHLTSIFTAGMTDGLLRSRGLCALFASSLYSDEPLRRLIAHYADDEMIAAVATQAEKGRLLLVATTNFATGEPVIWDLGSIALRAGPDAKPLFQSLLLASASVPGMLPPVVVRFRSGGRLRVETHVDGGVTLPFFIAPAVEDLPQSTADGPQGSTVRVIIDGPLRDLPRRTHANALSIFSRSLSAGLSHATRTHLKSTVESLHRRGIELDYAAIPASYALGGVFDFAPRAERSLFEYAENCARAGRLFVHAQPGRVDATAERRSRSEGATCPSDDSYIGHLAALEH
jgi:predicted acylesterase/phospholipase RssA